MNGPAIYRGLASRGGHGQGRGNLQWHCSPLQCPRKFRELRIRTPGSFRCISKPRYGRGGHLNDAGQSLASGSLAMNIGSPSSKLPNEGALWSDEKTYTSSEPLRLRGQRITTRQ